MSKHYDYPYEIVRSIAIAFLENGQLVPKHRGLSKFNKECALVGTKNEMTTTKTTTQQPLLRMFVFHVSQPSYLCTFAIYCMSY